MTSVDPGPEGFGLDPKVAYLDSKASYLDPKAAYVDPKVAYRDPEAAYRDPEVPYRDPKAAYRDPEAAYRDPEAAYRDPEVAYRDPEAAYRDPEVAYRDPKAWYFVISGRNSQKRGSSPRNRGPRAGSPRGVVDSKGVDLCTGTAQGAARLSSLLALSALLFALSTSLLALTSPRFAEVRHAPLSFSSYRKVFSSRSVGTIGPLVPANSCTWTGATSIVWSTASNWSNCGGVAPTSTDTATINTAANQPQIQGATTIAGLVLNSGTTLTIGNNATSKTLTVTGDTTNAGTIQPGGTVSVGLTVSGNITNNGTITGINGAAVLNATFQGTTQALNGSPTSTSFNSVTINNGATLTVGVNVSIAGNWTTTGAGGTLNGGANNFTFNGSATQTIAGGGTANFGNVVINNAALVSLNGNASMVSVNNSGTLTMGTSGTARTLTVTGTLTNSGTFQAFTTGTHVLNVGGDINNSGTFTPINGSGVFNVTLNGLSAQALSGLSSSTFNNLTDSNTAAAVSSTANFNVSGTLNMNGAGTLMTLDPAAQINSAGNTGTIMGTGRVQVTSLSSNPFSSQYRFFTFSVTALTVDWAGAGDQTIENGVSGYGGIRTSGSGTKTIGGSGTLAVNGDVTIGSGTTLAQGANTLNVSGNWSDSGTFTPGTSPVGVAFSGSGTNQTITRTGGGTETFSTLIINKPSGAVFPAAATDINVNGTSGNVLQLLNTTSPSLVGRTLTFSGNGGTLLTGDNLNHGFFGPGTIAITGNKTIAGAGGSSATMFWTSDTNVSVSAIFDIGSNITTIQGPVTVNSGGTLKGSGTTSGTVNVSSGGSIAPGNSAGIINSGSVTFTSGSNFNVEIGGATTPGTDYDQLNVTGTVTLGGATLNLSSLSFTPVAGNSFTIINNDSNDAVTGVFTMGTGGTDANGTTLDEGDTITNFLGSGLNATISYAGGSNSNDVVLTVAAADNTAPTINYTVFSDTASTSNRTLSVTVADTDSGVPTSGTGLPVIYYRKGSGVYSSNQCSFVSGNNYNCVIDNSLVSGGSVTAGDTIQYYVVAQDGAALPNAISNPIATGGYTANPPAAITPPTAPNSYTILAPKYRSAATGDWSSASTWEVSTDGGTNYSAASVAPTASNADTIEIQSGHTVTVTASVTADQLTVDSGGILAINFLRTLTLNDGTGTDLTINRTDLANYGKVNVADGGVIGGAGTISLTGELGIASGDATDGLAASIPTTSRLTLNSGSTVNFNGTGAQAIGARQYYNLTVSNARSFSPTLTFASGTVAIANAFDYSTTGVGSLVETGNTIEYNGTVANQFLGTQFLTYNNLKSNRASTNIFAGPGLVINGTLEVATGTFQISGPGSSDLNAVSIDTSSSTLTLSADITVSGDWANAGTLTHSNHTVTFDGGNAQMITTGGTGAGKTFGPVAVNKTAGTTATLAGDLSDTTLSITEGSFDQGGSYSLSSGAITVGPGATWQDTGSGTITLSSTVTNNGTINLNGGTSACNEPDTILIRSSSAGTQRAWSGSGNFIMKDLDVQDQAGTTVIRVESGTGGLLPPPNDGANWVFTTCSGGTLYIWTPVAPGTDTNYQNPLNWNPNRPPGGNPEDVLVVDGSASHTPTATITNIPATETIGRFRFINGTSATLSAAAGGATLTIGGDGTAAKDFDVANQSAVNFAGSDPLTISLSSGATGNIDNLLTFTGTGHKLIAANASAVTFPDQTICRVGPSYTGNPFGAGAGDGGDHSIVFQSGSTYIHRSGNSPFGAAGNTSVVDFSTGSTAQWLTNAGFQANNRTYANLQIGDATTQVVVSDSGTGNFTVDNLEIHNETGSTYPKLTFDGSGGSTVTIKANVTSDGGSGELPDIFLRGGTGGVVFDRPSSSISLSDNSGNSRAIQIESNASLTGGTTVTLFRKILIGQALPSTFVLSVPVTSFINSTGNTNYVIGKVLKNFDASHQTQTFPVGNATSEGYSPLVVSNASGTGSLTVNARSPGLPAISGANKLNRYWQITQGGSLASADLAFHYPASAATAGQETNYKFFEYSGGTFTQYNVSSLTTTDPNDHIATLTGVSQFSDWTLAEPAAVPKIDVPENYLGSEGDSGQNNFGFLVTRSISSTLPITFHYATSDGGGSGSAATGGANCSTPGVDYISTSGDFTINPSDTGPFIINVPVCGDTTVEPDEQFTLTLTNLTNAIFGQSTTLATITNDDAATPEIDVQGGAGPTSIPDASAAPNATDGTEFGSVTVSSSVSHPFTIANTGSAALTLTGTPLVQISGSSEFSVTLQPTSPVAASTGTTQFSITYAPVDAGTDMATVHIANDDSDEGDYDFVIQGTGVSPTTLTVNKIVEPGTDSGLFNLQIDLSTAGTGSNQGNNGTTGAVTVSVGSHTVGETAGTSTTLSDYTTAISGDCAADGTITLAAGDVKVCTITNTRKPTLTVNKVLVPSSDPGLFNLTIDTFVSGTGSNVGNGGTTGPVAVSVGSHTVGETSGTGTMLMDYTAVISGDCASDGTITLAAGDVKVCTITNTRNATCPTSPFVVNSNGDDPDAVPGDGICETASPGVCTLHAAIEEANALTSCPAITIDATSQSGTILLGSPLPAIDHDITLNGPGANLLTIDGATLDRVFTIASGRTVTINALTISNGEQVFGGGIGTSGGSVVTVTNCTISGNHASQGGGGINNDGTLTVINSTISGNSASGGGGGIRSAGTLTLANSTVSGNSAERNSGGVHNDEGAAQITNCTITNNTADSDDDSQGAGGGLFNNTGTVTLTNTIVAGNRLGSGEPDDLSGDDVDTANSANNLIGFGSGGLTDGVDGNQVGVANPRLGALQNNGGPTSTHALLTGSPAIEAGSDCVLTNTCTPALGFNLTTDQRGVTRPQGNHVDIGAFELQAYVVNTTADPGDGGCNPLGTGDGCTLREAINAANADAPSPRLIAFDIPGTDTGCPSGVCTIAPATNLPPLTNSIFINGYSQPGATPNTLHLDEGDNAALKIVLDGTGDVDVNARGIELGTGSDVSAISGLVINHFAQAEIYVEGSSANTIYGNFIGTDVTGAIADGGSGTGIAINDGSADHIGGDTPADRNLISGRTTGTGLAIFGSFITVEGNYIGTNRNGSVALGNNFGISIQGGAFNTIGCEVLDGDNVISGNANNGIGLNNTTANNIQGNFIGTDRTGALSVPNGKGIVVLDSSNNAIGVINVFGNFGNVISGNSGDGILIQTSAAPISPSTGNVVQANFIGTNAAGTAAIPNNRGIGLNGSSSNIIGGVNSGEGNLISGNADEGIDLVSSSNNTIQGNFIGTNISGAVVPNLGNGGVGIQIDPSTGNTIGAAVSVVVVVQQQTLRATTAKSGLAQTNPKQTVKKRPTNAKSANQQPNLPSISNASPGNVIAGNDGDGIRIIDDADVGNLISQNSIYSNGGLGIDLGPDGVTPNDLPANLDADTGANGLQNFPVISSVVTDTGSATIQFSLDSKANTNYTIEFFTNDDPTPGKDPSGFGEGQTFIHSLPITTDANGHYQGMDSLPSSLVAVGKWVTGTATDTSTNDTSEFSAAVQAAAPSANANPTITATTGLSRQQGSPSSNSQIATVDDADTGANSVTVTVNGGVSATVSGVTVSGILNTGGNVTANIVADCTAIGPATFTLTADDGAGGTANDTLTIAVTANTPPTLTYNTPQTVTEGNSLTINPATGPSDNGSVPSIGVQDAGGYPGSLSVDNATGVVTVSNAVSPGSYTITIRAKDNCTTTTDATFTLTVNPAACDTPPSGMVAWYPGDGNADDLALSNNGTLQNGATFAAGKVNQAFSLNGINQYVEVGYVVLPSTFTIDAWVNPSSLGTSNMVLAKDDGAGARSYFFSIDSSGKLVASVFNGTDFTQYRTNDPVVVTGALQHIAVSYDGSLGPDQKMKFYVDGVNRPALHLVTYDFGGTPQALAASARIGIFGDGTSPFAGLIDEVEAFNRALDATEIANIYNASFAGKCRTCTAPPSGMVSWWDGSGTGSTANDIADSNPGTLQGGATFAPGKVGQGFSFTSPGDGILVAHNANQNTGAQLTVDAWIKPANISTSDASIINKRLPDNTQGYTLELTNTGNGLDFEVTTASGLFTTTMASGLIANVWQHVAATYDGTAVKIYLNGVDAATAPANGTINAVTSDLVIGRNIVTSATFPGLIDEVELFNRALSPTEIRALADAGDAGKCHTSTVTVAVSPSSVLEDGSTNLIYTFTRNGDNTSPATVNFSTSGTATFNTDYAQSGATTFSASGGTLAFAANENTKTITIDPTADTTDEPDETVILTITSGAGYDIGTANTATGTITDDDAAPTITINDVTQAEGSAGPNNFTFTVSLSNQSSSSITVNYSTHDGTAVAPSDYTAIPAGALIIPANTSSGTIDVSANGDTTYESATETFTVTLDSATGGAIGSPSTGTGTIQDDDTAPSFSIDDVTHDEGNAGTTSYVFTVTKAGGTALSSSVNFTAVDGSATTGDNDYQFNTDTLTFGPLETTKQITVLVNADTKFEPDEAFTVHLYGATSATISDMDGTGAVTNDDSVPSISIDDVTHSEGNAGTTDYDFTVSLSNASYQTITVTAATTDDSATTGNSDYGIAGSTLTFNPDVTTQHFHVLVNGDLTIEPDEQFFVDLSGANSATIADSRGVGTIINDDTDVTVAVSPSSVLEDGATNLVYTFTRNPLTAGPITVNFSVGGTAVFGTNPGDDYTQTGAATFNTTSGTVIIPNSATTATVAINPTADTTVELDETVILTVTSGTGYNIGGANIATGTITTDDTDISVAVSPGSALEDGLPNPPNPPNPNINQVMVYTFTRTGVTSGAITVNFSVGGVASFPSDYTQTGAATFGPSSGTVTFGDGVTSATVTIDPITDVIYESNETVTLTVVSGTNYNPASPTAATGTITNDDPKPTLSIGDRIAFEGTTTTPSPTTDFVFTVTKNGPTEVTATVDFATADGTTNPAAGGVACGGSVDYESQTGSLTFLPNETSKTITVKVCRDATPEANETFFVNLSNESEATINDGQGGGTIQNDDSPGSFLTVNTTDDVSDGVCDAHCTLRDAITVLNGSPGGTIGINFAIPASDPRHFYYADDGLDGQVSSATITTTATSNDNTLGNIDPDWSHSWWSILPASALPVISHSVVINGYSQTGTAVNTLTTGDNALLRIELTNGNLVPSATGLTLTPGASTIRGLVINRWTSHGLDLQGGSGNSVAGNFIGTDVSGTLDLGNTGDGVANTGNSLSVGGSAADVVTIGDINLISGNNGDGISFASTNSDLVLGNLIGTKANGTSALGNGGNGISFSGAGSLFNTVGGTQTGDGNTIAFNGGDGVQVTSTAGIGNSIRGNSIFSNGTTAQHLGIDLDADGVTFNDTADPDPSPSPSRANNLQNFPLITSALVTGSTKTIVGSLNSTPGQTFDIDFYQSPSCDASGNGEGKTYIGSTSVVTDGSGDVPFTFHPLVPMTIGQVVTATATSTGASSSTSEFSPCTPINNGASGAGDIIFKSATYSVGEADGNAVITVTRTGGSNGSITANFSTSDGTANAPGDYTAASSYPITYNDGETGDKTVMVAIINDSTYESNETVNLTLGSSVINGPVSDDVVVDPHSAVLTINDNDTVPSFSIDDVTKNEGNSATTSFTFTVTRTGATEVTATVNFATQNGAAIEPGDYQSNSNTLTFLPADATQTVTVLVNGDTTEEPDEDFTVHLSSPTNASISDADGTGTIKNDDNAPVFSVDDVTHAEANGGTTNYVFTVTKTGTTTFSTSVDVGTTNGTATAPSDYTAVSTTTLNFAPTDTTKTITVQVNGDTTPELDETFNVKLSNPLGATISDDTGLGTITNDDESVSSGQLIISEFRLRGPGCTGVLLDAPGSDLPAVPCGATTTAPVTNVLVGPDTSPQANDEFIELYNATDSPLFVTTTDGSTGWAVVASDGTTRFIVPNGTIIPARGHFLGVNSLGYSLGPPSSIASQQSNAPASDAPVPSPPVSGVAGDATYSLDIPDNAGIAVFRTATLANFSIGTRLDAAGSTSESNTLYKEGPGYAPLSTADNSQNLEQSFFRTMDTTTSGFPKDTGDNAADFMYIDTHGTPTSAGQHLGAPGPENLSSPIRSDPSVSITLLDAQVLQSDSPNRVRTVENDPANASPFGTLLFRRRVVNSTGSPVTRLRFRIVEVTTLPNAPGNADLRARNSTGNNGMAISGIMDPATCLASTGSATTPCAVTVTATTLEQPPTQPATIGGGYNATLAQGTISTGAPLADGASVNVEFRVGIFGTGHFKFLVIVEALKGNQ